jgi:hypothetical protein
MSGDGVVPSTGPKRVVLHLRKETKSSFANVVFQIKKLDDGYIQKLNNFIPLDVITYAFQTAP